MAAKPPKPPGNCLNSKPTTTPNNNTPKKSATTNEAVSLVQCESNKSNNNNGKHSRNNSGGGQSESESASASASTSACDSSNAVLAANKKRTEDAGPNIVSESETTSSRIATGIGTAESGIERATTANNCNCTNISIMHLFHEMKQEFPTIPDPIVAQCVSENCHQRENCIQVLRNELALNPLTVQAYPAKVLQQQRQQQLQRLLQSNNNNNNNNNNSKQQPQVQLQNGLKPPTPLKPTRSAPTTPAAAGSNNNNNISNNNNNTWSKRNCDSVETVPKSKAKDVQVVKGAAGNSNSGSGSESFCDAAAATSDMPIIDATQPSLHGEASEAPTLPARQQQQHHELPPADMPPPHPPRARPTTLNLQKQTQQQQQQQQSPQTQRQLLNIQLQKYQQQRLQQQQQHVKPLRRAPLPPIPPKPTQFATPQSQPLLIQHVSASAIANGVRSSDTGSLSAASSSTSLASPLSSCGESELSPATTATTPTISTPSSASAVSLGAQSGRPLSSPIRHRSVITVQPEPPYTRDFLVASPTASSQKSFTSVNLTLRQPAANCVAPPSTIDISAGPGLSGAGGGLTYSSTSYDARRGYQKNFHITVTDEGGVFSASRIRPPSAYAAPPSGEQELDGPAVAKDGHSQQPAQAHEQSQQQQPQPLQRRHQFGQQHQQQHHTVASAANPAQPSREMCVPRKSSDDFSEILRRQRERRDRMANALRGNKRRLGHVLEEIDILSAPVSPGASERLDTEIQRLRTDCEAMLNEIENAKRCGPNLASSRGGGKNNTPQSPSFPRQRPPRPPLPMGRLEFVQHPVTSAAAAAAAAAVAASATTATTSPNSSPILQHHTPSPASPVSGAGAPPPPTYQQYVLQQQQLLQQQQQRQLASPEDEEDYTDSNTDGGEDDDSLEMWACNMCTFRNHPQLNICECCDNVRILPGTVRIVPAASASALGASSSSASLENDANNSLQQPQLALHT